MVSFAATRCCRTVPTYMVARILPLPLRCLPQQMFHGRINGKRVVGLQLEWFAGEERLNSFDPVLLDLGELLCCRT